MVTDTDADRDTDRDKDRDTDRDVDTQRHNDTDTQTHRHRDTHTHRDTETQTHRDTDPETRRHTETQLLPQPHGPAFRHEAVLYARCAVLTALTRRVVARAMGACSELDRIHGGREQRRSTFPDDRAGWNRRSCPHD